MINDCEVCKAEPSTGIACIPGMPVSVPYGQNCLANYADPLWALQAQLSAAGGPEFLDPSFMHRMTYLDGMYMSLKSAIQKIKV